MWSVNLAFLHFLCQMLLILFNCPETQYFSFDSFATSVNVSNLFFINRKHPVLTHCLS